MKSNRKRLQFRLPYIFFLCFILVVLLFITLNPIRTIVRKVNSRLFVTRHIAIGAWTSGLFDPETQTLHPEVLNSFERMIQIKVAIAHYYRGWETLTDPKVPAEFETLHHDGWVPMLNVNPYYFPSCSSPLPLYLAIANGECDQFLHAVGKNLSTVTTPFYFVFAWEMNNPSVAWNIQRTGSTGKEFIAAWRHIYVIFVSEHVTNVRFVFAPDVKEAGNINYQDIYPGDDVVSWVGLDGYNWGTTQSWSHWESFSDVFSASYTELTKLAPNKPVVIAETNTTDQGGSKSDWYTDMLTKQLPYNFPNVTAVILYNEDRQTSEHVNWLINVTNESLSSFISGIHTRFY